MSDDERRWHGFGYSEDEHWYEYDFGVAVGWVDGCIVLR